MQLATLCGRILRVLLIVSLAGAFRLSDVKPLPQAAGGAQRAQ